jgi:hypothetical protein
MANPPLWARVSTSSGVISNGGDPWGSEQFDGVVWRCMAVGMVEFVSTVGGTVAVVVAVRLLGLLWFADGGVERASTTLRSILDQTVVGIPFL